MENEWDSHEEVAGFYKYLLEENPEDLLARDHQQRSIMGTDKADPSQRWHHPKEMEMGWSHTKKTRKHRPTVTNMEPPGQEEERSSQEHLEERPWEGNCKDGFVLGKTV